MVLSRSLDIVVQSLVKRFNSFLFVLGRWIDISNVLKTFDGLYDLMLRDQFLYICNNEVMLFLKERVPKSKDEMTRYADQFKEEKRVNIVSLTNKTQKVDGGEPYDPDISPSVSVVIRQQARQRDNLYQKLKVPGSIKDVMTLSVNSSLMKV
ncbi:unnamed protein product [Mytilus coruscus]|uniref:Uncharacterized protein n=1 Tax=Mytilus coruscus TaxID=42192 RepID=A0A6J8AJG3_MYTCO|nr:unnamed protein product [Mytilus coruscus]